MRCQCTIYSVSFLLFDNILVLLYMCIFLCDLVMIILLSFLSLRLLLMCFQSGLSFLFYRSFNSLYLFWMEHHFHIIQLIVTLMFWSLWHCNFYSCDKKNDCLCVQLVALMLILERKERHSSWQVHLKFKFVLLWIEIELKMRNDCQKRTILRKGLIMDMFVIFKWSLMNMSIV